MNQTIQTIKKVLRTAGIVTVFVLLVSACDSDGSSDDFDPGDLTLGTAEITVTGSETATFTGTALSSGSSSQAGWGLVLIAPNALSSVTFVTASDRPGKGDYPIVDFTTTLIGNGNLVGSYSATQALTTYLSNNGTFDVKESSASSVEGTFSFTAVDGNGGNVTVAGSFRSTNLDQQ